MTKQEVLQNCTVEGNVIKLPAQQLDRKLYQEVAKALELIGGKWKGGKVFGFQFNEDPTEMLEQIANGETRNIKKEFQFFATPDDLADDLVGYAKIEENHMILEPSAGQGAIIKAIHRKLPNVLVHCYELMPINQVFLEKIPRAHFIAPDFLELTIAGTTQKGIEYDRIIANPPFSKNQDIDHIQEMYKCLKPGGRLVSIASRHWLYSTNKKEQAFKL